LGSKFLIPWVNGGLRKGPPSSYNSSARSAYPIWNRKGIVPKKALKKLAWIEENQRVSDSIAASEQG